MKIVADAHIPYVQDYFSAGNDLILKPGRAIKHQDVKDADILLVRSITSVNRDLLQHTSVKFVGSVTAGADHLDTEWLDQTGIAWRVASGFNAPPVADYVVSIIAALQRKNFLSQYGGKAAIIGVGRVGNLVDEKLRQLGFRTILCDPLRAKNEDTFSHHMLNDITDVDFISLHVPLVRTGEHPTFHFIDQAFLARQKPGCILLNASRGSVIDTDALLSYGQHLRWCLDVWEHEPRINKTVLEQACMASPHIAGYSVQSRRRGVEMIYQAACDKGLITPLPTPPLAMPHQTLTFAGQQHHWQDIVMGAFNPIVMTAMMKATLLSAENDGELFDEMRNQFHYRHELAYTKVACDNLLDADKKVLVGLGVVA